MTLAARGARNMDRGEEKIDDRAECESLRTQARRINRRAILVAALLTGVALLA